MCGIAGFHLYNAKDRPFSKREMERLVNKLLIEIEPRGKDATGVCSILEGGNFQLYKKDVPASEFVKSRPKLPKRPQTVLLHTRYATQGHQAFNGNNHPIVYGDAIIVHNGHIYNDHDLFWKEELKRNANVDSEVIAALFDKYTIDKAHIPLQKLDGNMAVAVVDRRMPGNLVLARGIGSPLHIYQSSTGLIWASTEQAIRESCKDVFGFYPIKRDIVEADEGDIYFATSEGIEKLKFTPYKRTYSWSQSKWHQTYSGNSDKDKSCETSQGMVQHGSCYDVWLNGKKVKYYLCDNCDHGYNEREMHHIGSWHFCDDCYKGADEGGEQAEIDAEFAAIVEDISVVQIEDVIEQPGVEVDKDKKYMFEVIAEKYNTTVEFVNYVLFEVEDNEFENDMQLLSMYCAFHDDFTKLQMDIKAADDAENNGTSSDGPAPEVYPA